MKIQEKFNKRGAALVDVGLPSVRYGKHFELGVIAEFFTRFGATKSGEISMHLTVDEDHEFGLQLIKAAHAARKS